MNLLISLFVLFALCSTMELAESEKQRRYMLNKPHCTIKRQKELELEMSRAVPIASNKDRHFPKSYAEVQDWCRFINRMVTKTETFFKDCYDKRVRDYASILIYTAKKNLKKYCGKKGSKVVRDMLKLAPCANKHIRDNSQPVKCYYSFMNNTAPLINIKNDLLKIPHACCNFVEGVRCAEEFLLTVPCMRPHVPMMLDYFRTGTSAITDIMCGEYNEQSDACSKLGKAPAPMKPNEIQYHTPMSLLIDLMESIKEFTPTPHITSF